MPEAVGFDDEAGRSALLDVDGDGTFETVVVDADSDGRFEAAFVDEDGDGHLETHLTRDDDGSFSKVDEPIVLPGDHDASAPDHDPVPPAPEHPDAPTDDGPDTGPGSPVDTMAGDPEADMDRWFYQVDSGLCMPASVTQIVVEMTNGQHSFDEVQRVAMANGWLQKGPDELFQTDKGYGWSGMTTDVGVELLQEFGLDVDQVEDMTTAQLSTYLESGYDIIATVDGDEVWYSKDDDAVDGGTDVNHALVVTGIDTTRGVVVLNDPGDPDGKGHEVPLNTFLDAWADGGNEAIVAAPPAGSDVGGEHFGDVDLVRAGSPGVVVLPVVLRASEFLDPDRWS